MVELLARQQVLWLQINSTQAYGDAARELRRAMLCFTQWDRVTVADIAFERIPRYQLYTRFPDPRGIEASDSIGTPAPKVNLRPRKRAVELTVLREDVAAPASDLRPTWPLELQRADLERFARRLTEAGGPRLEVPAYARRRNLWVASRGTRREVLNALEMLWGVGTLADPQRRVPPGLAEAHARPHTCRTAREARADGASSAAPVDRHHD